MTVFHRGDLVDYNGEPWTVYTGQDARGAVDLCRTEDYARPLGSRETGVAASALSLIRSAPYRTLGKGADIDYIDREDRNRGAARTRHGVGTAEAEARSAADDPRDVRVNDAVQQSAEGER